MSPFERARGAERVAERPIEGGGVFRGVGEDLHVEEAFGVERLADRADPPVHHVGGRDHVGPGARLVERLAHQRRDRLVVEDANLALVLMHQAVMAVAGIGVERDVGDEAELRETRA